MNFSPGTLVKAKKFRGTVLDKKPSAKQEGKIPVDSGRKIQWFHPSELRAVDEEPIEEKWKAGDRILSLEKLATIIWTDQKTAVIRYEETQETTEGKISELGFKALPEQPARTWDTWQKGDRVYSEMILRNGVVEKVKLCPQDITIVWEHRPDPVSYTPKDLDLMHICLTKCEVLLPEPEAEDIEEEELNLWEACGSLTYAQELGQDSPSQDYKPEDSSSFTCANETNIAEISSVRDSLISQSPETSTEQIRPDLVGGSARKAGKKKSTSLQQAPLANPSQCKENDSEPTTQETVSQQSYGRSQTSNPDTSRSKMCEGSYLAPTEQEPKHSTSLLSCESFTPAGTMQNGSWLAQDTLDRPFLESGCYWLEPPGALSSLQSRKPGQSRLESQLKANGILYKGECLNPIFLEKSFQLPLGWTDPSELRAATQLIAEEEKPSVTALTPELPPLPSSESSTFNQKPITPTTGSSPNKGGQTGSLYQYTANKSDKSGVIHTYPKVEGERKREEDSHWYWGFSYVEKEQAKWRDKSAAIPRKKLAEVRQALRDGKPYNYVLETILGK